VTVDDKHVTMPRKTRASKRTAAEYEAEPQKAETEETTPVFNADEELNASNLGEHDDSDVTDDEMVEKEVRAEDDAFLKELTSLEVGDDSADEEDDEQSSSDELLQELNETAEPDSEDEADDEGEAKPTAAQAKARRKTARAQPAKGADDDDDEAPIVPRPSQLSTSVAKTGDNAVTQEEDKYLVLTSDSDTSDDEHSTNRVGRIPMEWYHDYEHIGYGLDGKKVRLSSLAKGGQPRHSKTVMRLCIFR
jgi:ribosome biogenesis protein ERB1